MPGYIIFESYQAALDYSEQAGPLRDRQNSRDSRNGNQTTILVLAAILLLAGCSSNPTPFEIGEETKPMPGCIDYRSRGGEC